MFDLFDPSAWVGAPAADFDASGLEALLNPASWEAWLGLDNFGALDANATAGTDPFLAFGQELNEWFVNNWIGTLR
ncbi:hypothetical protein H7I76_30230 [Mycolicibacterium vaccae]|nr:hypothetical protein [Mycolicibacterium vaccae]